MKKELIKGALAVVLASASLIMSGCASAGALSGVTPKVEIIMDTYVNYQIDPASGKKYETVCDSLSDKGKNLEKNLLSRHEAESEISKINESAGSTDGYLLSEEMEEYITACLEISKETEGAFDISLGALIQLWNIDEAAKNEAVGSDEFVVPTEEEINKAKALCGYEKIKIDNHRIYIPEGMILDLGAVGKGILLDEFAKESGKIKNGFISAGGSIETFGIKNGGGDWFIGVKDPRSDDPTPVVALPLPGGCVISTSGDYERFIMKDGVRYHHILDPRTGRPADSGLASVTVVLKEDDNSGLISDALSTAIFVLGEEKGKALADKYKAYVLTIGTDGSKDSYGSDYITK